MIAVKTPSGLTEKKIISDKIMQGDVLGPLVSSNMVDKHIGKEAIASGHIYIYKKNVPALPLAMVDDNLGVSICGYRTTRTSIMGL